MQSGYYIEGKDGRNGPHDLITIMRRIQSGKVTADTKIYIGDAQTPTKARAIPEISNFFENRGSNTSFTGQPPHLRDLIIASWHFTIDHNISTVFAGSLLLLGLAIGVGFVSALGLITGGIIAMCLLVTIHHLYLVCMLRVHRGQTVEMDFITKQLMPVLGTLISTSVVLALMMAGGSLLLILPGIFVAVIYIFAPFLIFDRKFRLIESLQGSRLLLDKNNRSYLGTVTALVVTHLICFVLIIPIPITLPMFSYMLSELYEQLSAS